MKDKQILYGIFLTFTFILVTGLTYAFFSQTITGNDVAETINVTTTELKLNFTDGKYIELKEAMPGDFITKTFSVENTGTETGYYKINWQEFNNKIDNDELQVEFTCKSYKGNTESGTCSNLTREAAYNRDLKSNIEIESGIRHEYTLKLTFMDTNQNQNENQGKSFSGVLRVEGDDAGWENDCINNNSLRCKILSDNTLTSDSSIDFTKISSPTNGQGLYRDDKYGDSENYYFRGGSFCAYTDYLSENTTGAKCTAAGGTWTDYKCNYDLSKETCESKGFTWYELKNNVKFGDYYWKIIRIDDNGDVRLLYNGNATNARGTNAHVGTSPYRLGRNGDNTYVGYMQASTPAEYKEGVSGNRDGWSESNSTTLKMSKTYTFNKSTGQFTLGTVVNGSYTDDYIGYYLCEYGNNTTCSYLFQIVTTGVSSTSGNKMIKTMKVVNSYFTTSKKQAASNEINSDIKTYNENWYTNTSNLSTLASKISSNAGYCNDRMTTQTKDGGIGFKETIYDSRYRVYDLHKPSYKCTNESNDLFTLSSNTYGNKKLSAPVGLITADELAYAGSLYYNYNFQVYTHSGYWCWTLSPTFFSGGLSRSSYLNRSSNFGYGSSGGTGSVRSVVSLNSAALVSTGSGTLADPYIIN